MAAELMCLIVRRSSCSLTSSIFPQLFAREQARIIKVTTGIQISDPTKRYQFQINRKIHSYPVKCSSKGSSRTKSPIKGVIPKQKKDGLVCVAYSTAKSYNLNGLRTFLDRTEQLKYSVAAMPTDAHDVLHVCLKDNENNFGEIYFFRHLGSVVFWNVTMEEIKNVRHMVRQFQEGSYDEALIDTENEQMSFTYSKNTTNLIKGEIILNEESSEEIQALEKYAFSNAMALSVKLAIWEAALDQYVDSIKWVPEALRRGVMIRMSRKEVMKKTGELFSLRYKINLYSDLLMTPDFYWDHENLEPLYEKTCYYLEIARRTKVMNEKLTHCTELADLLREHLSEQHSFRLEWGIIWLIAIEVLFEIVHLVDRFYISSS